MRSHAFRHPTACARLTATATLPGLNLLHRTHATPLYATPTACAQLVSNEAPMSALFVAQYQILMQTFSMPATTVAPAACFPPSSIHIPYSFLSRELIKARRDWHPSSTATPAPHGVRQCKNAVFYSCIAKKYWKQMDVLVSVGLCASFICTHFQVWCSTRRVPATVAC